MQNKNKEIAAEKDRKLLGTQNRAYYQRRQEKKSSSLRDIYIFITVGILLICVLFLSVGTVAQPSFTPKEMFREIASAIVSQDFMNLSAMSDGSNNYDDEFYNSISEIIDGIMIPIGDKEEPDSIIVPDKDAPPTHNSIYDFDYSKVPEGHTPILPVDLSLSSYGDEYVYNSTGHSPNIKKLLDADIAVISPNLSYPDPNAPLVLVVHTHATECYSEEGAISYLDDGSELARSEDINKNVVSVGAVIAEELNAKGIPTLHCTILHDKLQYKDSYSRAEATIKEYLKKYPSIKLVIDVHRDSIIKSTGELVRPVTLAQSQPTAQVMCVVGSNWNGEACPSWEDNLALALRLRQALNSKYENLCRPPCLRASTYNQELAPYSLLLEIGASGNSLSEAKNAARLVANELAKLISNM